MLYLQAVGSNPILSIFFASDAIGVHSSQARCALSGIIVHVGGHSAVTNVTVSMQGDVDIAACAYRDLHS